MAPRHFKRLAAWWMLLQGCAGLTWWIVLLAHPQSRPWFFAGVDPSSTMRLLLPADLALFVGGSFAAAWASWRNRPWAGVAVCAQGGATGYAGLIAITQFFLSPSAWLGAALMLPCLIMVTILIAQLPLIRRVDHA